MANDSHDVSDDEIRGFLNVVRGDMHDEIQPVLTRDEWNRGQALRGDRVVTAFADPRSVGITAGNCTVLADVATAPAAIAMLNDLLPDDSPYKITRKNVGDLRVVFDRFIRSREASETDDANSSHRWAM